MEPLEYIGITHALFVTLFMLCKQPNTLSDRIIAVWMVFLACPMITRLCSTVYPNFVIPGLFSIRSFPLTFGPFLWFYTNSLVVGKRSITIRDLWHLLPFFIFALLQIVFPDQFFFPSVDAPPPSLLERMHGMSILLSLLWYSGRVLWLLKQHTRNVLDHFSSLPIQVTLRWLQWLTIGFIIAYMLPFSAPLLNLPQLFHFHGFAFTSFIFVLSFFGLKQPLVFQGSDTQDINEAFSIEQSSQEDEKPVEENQGQKYERSGLTEERAQEYLRRLEDFMQSEKPYFEADLTIEKLARQLHVPRHYLTQVLNEQLGKNFYLYINEYRVKEVKQRLLEPGSAHLTLLAIAYESGFNSKSTFNTVFKKLTNMTPSQFRKSQVQS